MSQNYDNKTDMHDINLNCQQTVTIINVPIMNMSVFIVSYSQTANKCSAKPCHYPITKRQNFRPVQIKTNCRHFNVHLTLSQTNPGFYVSVLQVF